jgi:GT2 family glycosyltransferase
VDLAVIIPCRNESAHLAEQLDALAAQEWNGTWEVILADNGSTDDSTRIAAAHEGLRGRLRVIDASAGNGVAYVRRCGVEATEAAAFVFCDGDDIVCPGWVAAMGDALATHHFVTGQVEVDRLNEPRLAATRGRRRLGQAPKFGNYVILSGGNGGMTRKGWLEFGGFDEQFVGLEDIELSLRIAAAGQEVHFVPEAVLHYRYRAGWRALWRQGLFYGASRVRLSRRCDELSLAPPPVSGALKSWAWLVLNLPRAPLPGTRLRWTWTLASRVGAARATLARPKSSGVEQSRVRASRVLVTRAVFRARLSFARRPVLWCRSAPKRSALHLVTIAFDNPRLTRAQLAMLRDCLIEPKSVTVADNSPSRRNRRLIRKLCAEFGAEYYPLPHNPFTGRDPSRSHAEALNHVCRHLRDLEDVEILGFLDHDVFPTESTRVLDHIAGHSAYGVLKHGEGCWYLWPGLVFLRLTDFVGRQLDFHPVRNRGDTGSTIYFTNLRYMQPDRIATCSSTTHEDSSGASRVVYERHDGWIHTINGSRWREEPNKDDAVLDFLRHHGLHGS